MSTWTIYIVGTGIVLVLSIAVAARGVFVLLSPSIAIEWLQAKAPAEGEKVH